MVHATNYVVPVLATFLGLGLKYNMYTHEPPTASAMVGSNG